MIGSGVAAWSHSLGSSQSCTPSPFPVQTLTQSSGPRLKCPGSMASALPPQHKMYLRSHAGVYMVYFSSKHHFYSHLFLTQVTERMFQMHSGK